MSQKKKEIRAKFRDSTFKRDSHRCRVCGESSKPLDAHHITDRTLMPNGGYVTENGISLCPECHEKAEVFHSTGTVLEGFSPEDLYRLICSSYELAVQRSHRLG